MNTNSKIDLTVIGGAGHIGLPLALVFADKGFNVLIHDIDQRALATIQSGKMPSIEHGAEELLERALASGKLLFSSNLNDLPLSGPIIITIGTPVDEFLNPVHTTLKNFFATLAAKLTEQHLLILRSTVYPGTTDWLASFLQQKDCHAKIAFCPERIVQGNAISELTTIPQIVSATTNQAKQQAGELFKQITDEIVYVEPIEAEFAKLFCNAYRYIQFAASNQFYTIVDSANVNYSNVVKAMTKGYTRMQGFPSAGLAAGPCLFKDTMQLAAFAQNQFGIGSAAMLANEGLPLYLVGKMKERWDLSTLSVGLLGMAFKSEIDDNRSSLSYKLKKLLVLLAKNVFTTDPYVVSDPSLLPVEQVIAKSDVLVHCTPHKCYQDLDLQNKPVVDVWGILSNANAI